MVLEEIAEVIIDEPSAAVPVLRIQEHIAMQFDEQVVAVPATASQEEIAESLRLNPQDRISYCIDEQIVPAPVIQDENIEMNLEEHDELVQPFLRKCSSEDITVSPPRMAQGSCSARSDLSPMTVAWEAQRALMLGKVGEH